jgi:hypothetical protein
LGTAKAPEGGEQVGHERGHAIRSTVRKGRLGERPDALVGVQLWRVGGKELRAETGEALAERANEGPLVNPAVVPEDDDRPAQVMQEVPEKLADLGLADVGAVHAVVEAEAMSTRTHRDAGNDREAVVALPEAQQRGLPARRPGLAHTGDQEEARFVDEDEVGAQPRGVFFTRGHTRRFHWTMRCSSRWRARDSGFWWLHPSLCISRPT